MRKLLILLAVCALVGAFSLPAAADVSFYGQVNMTTGFTTLNEDWTGGDSDTDLDWALDVPVISQFGARFKNGDVSANVEFNPDIDRRHFYGAWNFGAGTLIVGHTWTPTCVPAHTDVYKAGVTPWYGNMVGSVRQPQIGLQIGSFKLATITPYTSTLSVAGADTDVSLPRIEASYNLKAGPASITLFGGFNTYTIEAADSYTVSSSLVGGTARLGFGAVGVALTVWTAQNLPNGTYAMPTFISASYSAADDEIKNVAAMGYGGSVSYTLSETMKVTGGYFGLTQDVDDVDDTDNYNIMYVNLPITLAKGVTLAPEVRVINHPQSYLDGEDHGSSTSYGAYWAIAF
jgi:hypothetical protein